MNDTIYRQAAIDAIEKAKTARTKDGEIYVAKINAEMNIDLLPSVQEQRWIPVSKDLPKGQELVNVSCHDTLGDTSFDYTSSGWVTTDGEYWIVDNEINNYVVAWMPLPKPYKGEPMRITELVNHFPELKNRPADEVFKIAERQNEIEEDEARREMERYFNDNGDPRRYEYY